MIEESYISFKIKNTKIYNIYRSNGLVIMGKHKSFIVFTGFVGRTDKFRTYLIITSTDQSNYPNYCNDETLKMWGYTCISVYDLYCCLIDDHVTSFCIRIFITFKRGLCFTADSILSCLFQVSGFEEGIAVVA